MFIVLVACFDDQKREAAACDIEARRVYPGERIELSWANYVTKCMEAHGYDWHISDKRCEVRIGMESNPYCYVPSGWLPRRLYDWEVGSG
jgi:hypothetical protein